jgi:hypothetical protein
MLKSGAWKMPSGRNHGGYKGTEHIAGQRFSQWKAGAERRGLPWNLTIDEIESLWARQKGCCALTGDPMSLEKNDRNVISLDRIDSDRGYEVGNVQLTTWRVNEIKSNLLDADFIEMCRKVAAFQQELKA